jgi:hypothetical protein
VVCGALQGWRTRQVVRTERSDLDAVHIHEVLQIDDVCSLYSPGLIEWPEHARAQPEFPVIQCSRFAIRAPILVLGNAKAGDAPLNA